MHLNKSFNCVMCKKCGHIVLGNINKCSLIDPYYNALGSMNYNN